MRFGVLEYILFRTTSMILKSGIHGFVQTSSMISKIGPGSLKVRSAIRHSGNWNGIKAINLGKD